jgi:hypothetical protein
MTEHYCLLRPKSERLFASWDDAVHHETAVASTCSVDPEHGGLRRACSLALQVGHNKRDEAMIFSWIGDLAISNELAEKLSKKGIGGFRCQPATVRFRNGELSRDYSEFIVTGWAGVARPESGVSLTFACPGCSYKKYSGFDDASMAIDWNQWTGEDVFMLWPLPKIRLITSRVADILDEQQVKSYTLATLDDYYRGGGFTVGGLSKYMSADLAAKYGRPPGIE